MTNVLPFEQRVRGRAAPARQRHTFRDSGITVELHKIGPTVISRIFEAVRKEAQGYPKGDPNRYPDPPIEAVEIGGVASEERNVNSPEYRAALDEWAKWAQGEGNNRFIRMAAADAVVPLDTTEEEIRIAADETRRRMAREGADIPYHSGYSQEENDRIVWVTYVCIASGADLQEFYAALTQRTVVSEEAVEAHTATFQPS